jgi:hypothetical protein
LDCCEGHETIKQIATITVAQASAPLITILNLAQPSFVAAYALRLFVLPCPGQIPQITATTVVCGLKGNSLQGGVLILRQRRHAKPSSSVKHLFFHSLHFRWKRLFYFRRHQAKASELS